MAYKFVLKDKREFTFPDEATAIREAQSACKQLNQILIIRMEQNGSWPEFATIYPSGEIRKPVDVGGFARSLEPRRRRP